MSKRGALVNQILEGIKNGSLVENGQLPSERALANQLGISRILLRETIVVLETLGVVESKERLGIFVKKPDISGLAESLRIMPYWSESFVPQLIEIRLMTDVQAAELAALRRTEKQLEELRQCLATFLEIGVDTPQEAKLSSHYEYIFHRLIVAAANNDILIRVYEGLSALMEKNNYFLHEKLTRDTTWGKRVKEHHRNIFQAIQDEDPEKAKQWMRTHLFETRDRYGKILEELKGLFI